MNIVKQNEYGHTYHLNSHIFFDENNQIICRASSATEIFEKMNEEEQDVISLLVSRAYNAGKKRKEIEFKNFILNMFNITED